MRWRLRSLFAEAYRNAFSPGPARIAVVLALLFGVLVGGVDAARTHSLTRAIVDARADGRNTLVLTGEGEDRSGGMITRSSCAALEELHGVERAGSVVEAGFTDTLEYGPRVPVALVSGSLLPALRNGDAVVGAGIHGQEKTSVDSRMIRMDGVSVRAILGTPEPAGVDLGASIATLMPASITEASICVLELHPLASADEWAGSVLASVDAVGAQIRVMAVDESRSDPVGDFLVSPLRWSACVLGAVGALVAIWRRLGESSSLVAYRATGTSVSEAIAVFCMEQCFVAGCFVASSMAMLALLGDAVVDPLGSAARVVLGAAMWMILAIGGIIPVVTRDRGATR